MPKPNLKGCCWGLTNLTGLSASMVAEPARHRMRHGVLPGKRVRRLDGGAAFRARCPVWRNKSRPLPPFPLSRSWVQNSPRQEW